LTFVKYLRAIADDQILPDDAVRAYHGDLQRLKLRPHRSLEDDLTLTPTALSYGGAPPTAAGGGTRPAAGHAKPASTSEPDFNKMTSAEKVAWNLARWKRILGG
jgi:hypothetical protein